jgi:hypothetical protein
MIEVQQRNGLRIVLGEASMLGIVSQPTAPSTTADIVTGNPAILAAIDGPMFDYAPGEPHSYATFRKGVNKCRLWYPTRAVDVASRVPNDGIAIAVSGERASAQHGAGNNTGADALVQLYPTLVRDRRVTAGLRGTVPTACAGVGIAADGRVALIAASSMTLPQFAAAVGAAGFVDAGYTDGGGSTALYADIEKDGRAEQAMNLRGRRVISWITLERKSPARNVLERAKAAIGTGSDGVLGGALTVTGALVLAGALMVSRNG